MYARGLFKDTLQTRCHCAPTMCSKSKRNDNSALLLGDHDDEFCVVGIFDLMACCPDEGKRHSSWGYKSTYVHLHLSK